MRLLFDIESNGLLDTVTKIWCLGIIDLDTNIALGYGPDQLEQGLKRLEEADELWGHNIITYDIPCIHKLSTYPRLTSKKCIDTLILSRLYYPHIGDGMDWVLIRRGTLPANMRGRHSLEAWGHRIGVKKDSYGKDKGFDEYTPAMLDYCLQDLQVNLAFIRKIEKECQRSERAEQIEMDFQQDIATHGALGCPFKIEEATKYHDKLERVGGIVFKKIKELIPDKEITETVYPARSDKKKGIVKGVSYQSTRTIDVNPRSTDQMAEYFKTMYDWKPEKFTDKNKIAMDDSVLNSLTFPEVKYLRMMYAIDKVQSKLKGTSKALLANTIGDRIYGGVITLGAVTGRCTHMVISNMPMELRSFFGLTDDSWRMVGCDAKAIQLRILAHYIDNYDPRYKDVVLNGDIHTVHQKAFDLQSRDQAKTFIYACVTMDTLVLGRKGWLAYKDLKLGDLVLTYNSDKNVKEWKPILEIVRYGNADVVEMSHSQSFRVKVTPNHRWFVKQRVMTGSRKSFIRRYYDKRVMTTDEINTESNIIVNAPFVGDESSTFEYIVDKYNTDWVSEVLKMSSRERKAFMQGFLLADGYCPEYKSSKRNRSWKWVQNRGSIQEAALLLSFLENKGHVYSSFKRGKNKDMCTVIISNKEHTTGSKLTKRPLEPQDVFCIRTENSSFVMRQGDCITITGNTIFGAGQEKLGSIINPNAPSHEQKRIGKQAMDKMAVNLPALSSLINDVKHTFSVRGYVKGVDGRPLFPRGAHTALCTLIQNAESVIMKRATRIMIQLLENKGIMAQMVIHYHDEYNWICHKDDAEQVAKISMESITHASNELGMKCVNEGSAKIGMNWKEIH